MRDQLEGLCQQQIAFAISHGFGAPLVAEFVLPLFLYERFWLPIIIIGCSLFSTAAVVTGAFDNRR